MARIRSIKPEFWSSEQVVECSPIARLLFIGMWNFCDDLGRHPLSVKTIKARIFPSDDISADEVSNLVLELEREGLIEGYLVDGKGYLHITGWHHQKIDKPQPAKYPGPECGPSMPIRRIFSELSANDRGSVSTERKGREGIGEDSKSIHRVESLQDSNSAPPDGLAVIYGGRS
jgi:hypothetical protein